ncbi:hypothetical protein [Desulfurivibrio alkaliphilus]|uniref:hypothetical protein n=1 Tax=Desulfurivibrio alkaliphilus TaxID=427923 RepID=UPI0012FF139A|nr:hypothetical protein [Desulfurivibrio alkaliphilus]
MIKIDLWPAEIIKGAAGDLGLHEAEQSRFQSKHQAKKAGSAFSPACQVDTRQQKKYIWVRLFFFLPVHHNLFRQRRQT